MVNKGWLFLSYPVSDQLSAYRNGRRIEKEMVSSIKEGGVSNHTSIRVSLHFGTHIDFPNHFITEGKTSLDYAPDYFIVDRVALVFPDKLQNPHLLSVNDLKMGLSSADRSIQCVLVHTGMGLHRNEDCYWNDNVGVDLGVAAWLREEFPQLRFLGFDFMSVSGSHNRDLGRLVHRELLENGILPIEDMLLAPLKRGCRIKKLIVSPYRVTEADAAPVTVFCKLYD